MRIALAFIAAFLTQAAYSGPLSDAMANPTVTGQGAFCLMWNGSTWDRCPGTVALGLKANLTAGDAVVGRVKISDGTDLANVTAGGRLEVTCDNCGGGSTVAIEGEVAHDASGASTNPALVGGYASAAAPTNVSADGDAVRAWHLLSGAYVTQLSYGGTLASTGNGVTGAGVQRVTIASDQTAFTVNAAQSGTWNVTNVSGTVSLPTGASTLSEQQTQTTALQIIDNLPVAQGSTTSGQSGALIQGAVTTAAPSYTTAQTSPLSLSTAGNLRVDGSSVTQPVSGTVTANLAAGTNNIGDVDVLTLPALVAGSANIGDVDVATIAAGDNNIGNVDVVTMPSVTVGTFPDNEPFNVAQINGVTPLMGNGTTGTGSQRVTIASDNTAFTVNVGTFPDNEPVNVAQMNGVAVTMGNGTAGTGVQRVAIASDNTAFTVNAAQSGTWTVQPGNTANTTGWFVAGGAAIDAASTGNPTLEGARASTATPTAVSADGDAQAIWVDRSGAQVMVGYAAQDAAIAGNPNPAGLRASSTLPTAMSAAGDVVYQWGDLNGATVTRGIEYVTPWSCGLAAVGTTLTQCQAAPGAGLSLYITAVIAQSNTTTAGLHTLRFGTGSNCGTGTGNLMNNSASALLSSPANTLIANSYGLQGMKLTANNALCVLGVATNTTNITITGFTAP